MACPRLCLGGKRTLRRIPGGCVGNLTLKPVTIVNRTIEDNEYMGMNDLPYRILRRLPFKEAWVPMKMLRGNLMNRGFKMPQFEFREDSGGRLEAGPGGVPILRLRGKPGEVGYQHGRLLAPQIAALYERYLGVFGGNFAYDLQLARRMEKHIPKRYTDELRGIGEGAGIGYDRALVAACFLDLHKIAMCSTFVVHGNASALPNGELIFGRNLDFPSLGLAHHCNLLIHTEVEGARPWVAVSWPGFSGVLTGMNSDGLCLAMMLIYGHTRHERLNGVPFPLHYRQMLEDYSRTDDVVARFEKREYATGNNVMLADTSRRAAVCELRGDSVGVIRPEEDFPVLRCTNHYRTGQRRWGFSLTAFSSYPRMWRLAAAERGGATVVRRNGRGAGALPLRNGNNGDHREPFTVADVRELLAMVAIRGINLQRVVFLPESRSIEVAFGDPKTRDREYHRLGSDELFGESVVGGDNGHGSGKV